MLLQNASPFAKKLLLFLLYARGGAYGTTVSSCELMKKPEGIISLGAKMGEGWLLTAEMIELVEGGYGNIVCAQPFGCLPNHIVGKGMINKIRALHPDANITPVDYDPSATRVNQENRIKLMLAVARERLDKPAEAPAPLTAEALAGGAPQLETVVP